MRRLFGLLILLGLLGAGLYYWRYRATGVPPRNLTDLTQALQDTKTTAEVKAALGLNRTLKPYSIEVATERGVVSLRGDVPSDGERATAERVASAVPNVRRVINHVRISPGAAVPDARERTLGESLDDHTLEVQVRLALDLNRELQGTEINVKAFRRGVTLSGEASAPAQQRLAEQVARETAGVGDVKNEIRVRPSTPSTAAAGNRRAAVEEALAANKNLKPYRIKAREEDGRLILAGRVRTGAEKDLAGLLARDAAGMPVENALEVRP